jgi:hypothetical protein
MLRLVSCCAAGRCVVDVAQFASAPGLIYGALLIVFALMPWFVGRRGQSSTDAFGIVSRGAARSASARNLEAECTDWRRGSSRIS